MWRILCSIFLFLFLLFPQKVFAEDKLVINEFLVHPSSGNDEWIEIYNPTNIDLTSYWVDDDTSFTEDVGNSNKKQLTTIVNSLYSVFTLSSSIFNNSADHVVLFDADGNIIDQYEYTDDPGVDLSVGRSPDGANGFQILASSTKGSVNSEVLPTPTLTPTEAPTPTRTPTPTKTPTPTPLRPTSSSTSRDSSGQAKVPTIVKAIAKNILADVEEKISSLGAIPTSILGASTSSIPTPKKDSKVLVNSASEKKNYFVSTAIILGAILIISCGVIIYRKRMNREL